LASPSIGNDRLVGNTPVDFVFDGAS
jgi:hypothetical protein